MEFWKEQLEQAQRRVAESEHKIAQQPKLLELDRLGVDQRLHMRLMAVLRENLSRAKAHVHYIEQRIAAHEADVDKRAARTALIQSLKTKHSQSSGAGAPCSSTERYQRPMNHFAPTAISQIAANTTVSTVTAASIAIASKSPSSSR